MAKIPNIFKSPLDSVIIGKGRGGTISYPLGGRVNAAPSVGSNKPINPTAGANQDISAFYKSPLDTHQTKGIDPNWKNIFDNKRVTEGLDYSNYAGGAQGGPRMSKEDTMDFFNKHSNSGSMNSYNDFTGMGGNYKTVGSLKSNGVDPTGKGSKRASGGGSGSGGGDSNSAIQDAGNGVSWKALAATGAAAGVGGFIVGGAAGSAVERNRSYY